jgi:carbonic anhydrase
MRKMKNYCTARAAAIVAMIPLLGPCCLLGIPGPAFGLLSSSESRVSKRHSVRGIVVFGRSHWSAARHVLQGKCAVNRACAAETCSLQRHLLASVYAKYFPKVQSEAMKNQSLDRRHFVGSGLAGFTALCAHSSSSSEADEQAAVQSADQAIEEIEQQQAPDRTPEEILQSLIDGNERFVNGKSLLTPRTAADFARDAKGQAPPAVILGCADSRVPPEFIFDQPNGSLFVLRVAGNIVGSGPILKGSIEFAVAELGARLIVVMGHSECGACKAAIEHIERDDLLPGSIGGMVDYIRPVVSIVGKQEDKLTAVIKANALQNARRLAGLEPILSEAVRSGEVKVVAAYYELNDGRVEFLNT